MRYAVNWLIDRPVDQSIGGTQLAVNEIIIRIIIIITRTAEPTNDDKSRWVGWLCFCFMQLQLIRQFFRDHEISNVILTRKDKTIGHTRMHTNQAALYLSHSGLCLLMAALAPHHGHGQTLTASFCATLLLVTPLPAPTSTDTPSNRAITMIIEHLIATSAFASQWQRQRGGRKDWMSAGGLQCWGREESKPLFVFTKDRKKYDTCVAKLYLHTPH